MVEMCRSIATAKSDEEFKAVIMKGVCDLLLRDIQGMAAIDEDTLQRKFKEITEKINYHSKRLTKDEAFKLRNSEDFASIYTAVKKTLSELDITVGNTCSKLKKSKLSKFYSDKIASLESYLMTGVVDLESLNCGNYIFSKEDRKGEDANPYDELVKFIGLVEEEFAFVNKFEKGVIDSGLGVASGQHLVAGSLGYFILSATVVNHWIGNPYDKLSLTEDDIERFIDVYVAVPSETPEEGSDMVKRERDRKIAMSMVEEIDMLMVQKFGIDVEEAIKVLSSYSAEEYIKRAVIDSPDPINKTVMIATSTMSSEAFTQLVNKYERGEISIEFLMSYVGNAWDLIDLLDTAQVSYELLPLWDNTSKSNLEKLAECAGVSKDDDLDFVSGWRLSLLKYLTEGK